MSPSSVFLSLCLLRCASSHYRTLHSHRHRSTSVSSLHSTYLHSSLAGRPSRHRHTTHIPYTHSLYYTPLGYHSPSHIRSVMDICFPCISTTRRSLLCLFHSVVRRVMAFTCIFTLDILSKRDKDPVVDIPKLSAIHCLECCFVFVPIMSVTVSVCIHVNWRICTRS